MPTIRISNLASVAVGLGSTLGVLAPGEVKHKDVSVAQLEHLSASLATLQRAQLISWSVEVPDEGQTEFFPVANSLTKTTQPLTFFLSGKNGNDSNDGLTFSTPLATWDAAIRKIKQWDMIGHRVILRVGEADPGSPYVWNESIGPMILGESLIIIGDGAGQPDEDGFTELQTTSIAQGGSGLSLLVTSGGLVENAFHGKTVEILTGAAAGDRRSIRNNTTTDIVPSASFTAALAASDTYRIVEPAVEVYVTGYLFSQQEVLKPQFLNVGGPAGAVLSNSLLNFGNLGPMSFLLNFKLVADDTTNFTTVFSTIGSCVSLGGIEFVTPPGSFWNLKTDSVLYAGCDLERTYVALYDAGLAEKRNSWVGWGIHAPAITYQLSSFIGFLTSSAEILIENDYKFLGGSIITATGTLALDITRFARVTWGAAVPTFLVRNETNTASSVCVSIRGGAAVILKNLTLEKMNQGFGVAVYASSSGQGALPGHASIEAITITGITGATAPTNAIVVSNGGTVGYRSNPTITGFTAGTQLAVRKESYTGATAIQQADMTALVADGDALPAIGTADGRYGWIRRV